VFGVRKSLISEYAYHAPTERRPAGFLRTDDLTPFYTVDFDFVLVEDLATATTPHRLGGCTRRKQRHCESQLRRLRAVECAGRRAEDRRSADRASRDLPHQFYGLDQGGSHYRQAAAEHLKPVLLELGGKAPLVVLDDADLDQAVDAAAFGAFMNQGQICMSTERVIVDDKVADAFGKA